MAEKPTPRDNIRNCPWGYNCEKTWSSLAITGRRDVRYCHACEEPVHLCRTQRDVSRSVLGNRCVAFHPKLIKTIEARDTSGQDPGLVGLAQQQDDDAPMVIGQIDTEYLFGNADEDPLYAHMLDGLLGDGQPGALHYSRCDNGQIHCEVDFPGYYEKEFVISISAAQVADLGEQLGEAGTGRILDILRSQCPSIGSLTDYLRERGIRWSTWAWGS